MVIQRSEQVLPFMTMTNIATTATTNAVQNELKAFFHLFLEII